MMSKKRLAAMLGLVLGTTGAWAEMTIVDVDGYPLMEVNVVESTEAGSGKEIRGIRLSFIAGALEFVKRPELIKFRLVPLVYQKIQHEQHLQVLLLGPKVYVYEDKKGVVLELKGRKEDPSNSSLLSWRGNNDDPYLSGGMAMLLGQIVGHYGYRGSDGGRERVCKLTEVLVYANNEKRGCRLSSVSNWVFSCEWNKPEHEKTWEFGLLKKCLCVGRLDGKPYGRFLWLPVGKAPKLWPKWAERKAKQKTKKASGKQESERKRKRVSI